MVAGFAQGWARRSRARTRRSVRWRASSPGTLCRLRPLLSLIDARSADLYSDPPPSLADLEELFGKTQSSLFELAGAIAGVPAREVAPAARDTGLAYGLARRLAHFCRRPGARADDPYGRPPCHGGARREGRLCGAAPRRPAQSVAALANLARHHLRVAEAEIARLPRRILPAFLPLAVVAPLLDRMQQLDAEILERPAGLSDLETILRIGIARFRGRIGAKG